MLRDKALVPLSHQHHNGLALCVLTRRAMAADGSTENLGRLGRRIGERYDLELANHFEIEEQVLFPLCGPKPLVAELIAEHRQLETLVAEVRERPAVERLEEFCALLSSHIRREENELFEEVQREAPRAELDRAGEEIDRRAIRVCLPPD
ncbi:MAG TPA: hemerythrin domain-containing protein [Verrucomicrobiae bacterium]|nr:hemerythrin domain-containing protein [Verrucomicrobiae bacterium]